ncbi:hypothetical protein KC573_01600 [candidate division WWE3 bacterium]|uniref:Uncharacterized protein n=1 Tax=candidate division WWE3 bacterium TaxID=2053526 RepID=A0A955RWX2_UNCKA|nr:hypothetical protein [candidate division WWE3 bacterium]
MQFKKYPARTFRHLVSIPFIYMMVVPLVFLDIFMEVYHRICFPLYGLPLFTRNNYIRIDRQKLSYLTLIEKLNCMYCGYANGLLAYGVAIAGKTEEYWCGIKHQKQENYQEPKHHDSFIEYGDESEYNKISSN